MCFFYQKSQPRKELEICPIWNKVPPSSSDKNRYVVIKVICRSVDIGGCRSMHTVYETHLTKTDVLEETRIMHSSVNRVVKGIIEGMIANSNLYDIKIRFIPITKKFWGCRKWNVYIGAFNRSLKRELDFIFTDLLACKSITQYKSTLPGNRHYELIYKNKTSETNVYTEHSRISLITMVQLKRTLLFCLIWTVCRKAGFFLLKLNRRAITNPTLSKL